MSYPGGIEEALGEYRAGVSRRREGWGAALLAALALGCQARDGIAPEQLDGRACAIGQGGEMLLVSGDGPAFCMERTETTQADYQVFVDAVAAGYVPQQSAECASFNNDFVVHPGGGEGTTPCPTDPVGTPDAPVVCINWCDAAAYCAWAGRRLCTGGPDGEWVRACQGRAAAPRRYSYGDAFRQECSDLPAHQADDCDTSAGVFFLSGSVAEMTATCVPGISGTGRSECDLLGGSSRSDAEFTECAATGTTSTTMTYHDLGFRCCATPRGAGD